VCVRVRLVMLWGGWLGGGGVLGSVNNKSFSNKSTNAYTEDSMKQINFYCLKN